MSIWKVLFWLVPTLGLAGTITLFVLYPLIARAIGSAILNFFAWVFSYRLGCAIIAAVAVGFAVDYWRHDRDDKAYAERTAMFEHAQKVRDAKIAEETRQAVWIEIANETAANTATDNEVKEFTNELRPLPAADTTCRVGPAAERLHVISGQIDRRSKGNRTVPAARRPGPRAGL
jgi:uncharacterized membrane protein YraQ (UPF0718 family)